jgi:hypothetical protein
MADGGLPAAARRDCQTSGFDAAMAPTGNYGFDVHINGGLFGVSSNVLSTAVQDLLITPLWIGLIWVVHALVVAVEWSYTIDLLDSPAMRGVTQALRDTQATFTAPWLVLVLAVASVIAVYHGLVRRRIAETLGEVLLLLAMTVAGMWVIVDPVGTIGALGRWSNDAGIGTLGAVARGTPDHAPATLADSMRAVFGATVGAPWCYLEFGNVRWCADPAQVDSRLRTAAAHLASTRAERTMVAAAATNGDLFLAFPANQSQRNAINQSGSLLNVLCQSQNDTGCSGPTAQQAEFRTTQGTWPRAAGLLLILAGSLGMILLLGSLVGRLLGAAVMSLVYLLLAPAAVLAPALGDGGRAAFRGWAMRLLGAVSAKLTYSFLLGLVLLMMRILLSLDALGFWVQWMLISLLWWSAFRHRNQLFGMAAGAAGNQHSTSARGGPIGRLTNGLRTTRELGHAYGWVKRKQTARELSRRMSATDEPRRAIEGQARAQAAASGHAKRAPWSAGAGHRPGSAQQRRDADEQVSRTLDRDLQGARLVRAANAGVPSPAQRDRLARLRDAHQRAQAAGDRRRAARLGGRAAGVESAIDAERERQDSARRRIAASERARRDHGAAHAPEQRVERARLLDAQMSLPADKDRRRGDPRRAYQALAGLAGLSSEQYQQLGQARQREARLQIDRELALRKELSAGARPEPARAERAVDAVERSPDTVERPSDAAERARERVAREWGLVRDGDGWVHPAPARESTVMKDARAVAEGRKRQLGWRE